MYDASGLGLRFDTGEEGLFGSENNLQYNVVFRNLQGGLSGKSNNASNYRNTGTDNQGGFDVLGDVRGEHPLHRLPPREAVRVRFQTPPAGLGRHLARHPHGEVEEEHLLRLRGVLVGRRERPRRRARGAAARLVGARVAARSAECARHTLGERRRELRLVALIVEEREEQY